MEDQRKTALGARIKGARERMRWSQKQLADAVDLGSPQIVSTIESGQRELKAWELARIASVLQTSLDALLTAPSDVHPVMCWRAKPSGDIAGSVEARFLLRCQRYALLEQWCEIPPHQELKPLTLRSPKEPFHLVEREADNVRNAMRLGGRPACALEKTLGEDYGVKIFYESLGDEAAGLCAKGDFGDAILLNADNAPWRRNYSLAHELFHLMAPAQWSSLECQKIAEVFASALLLPEESLMSAVRTRLDGKKIPLENLVEIASEFDVSIDALLWRLVNLGRLKKLDVQRRLEPHSRLRALDRFSRNPRSATPKPGLPERYVRLCYTAYIKERIGRSKLAEFLEMPLIDLVQHLDNDVEGLTGAKGEIAVAGC